MTGRASAWRWCAGVVGGGALALCATGVAWAQATVPARPAAAASAPVTSASAPAVATASPPAPAPQQIVVAGRGASSAEERRDATVGMTVVGREELDQHGDLNVLDVLQRLPGISLDGETPRLRGLGGGYTLILLNGEPAPPGFSLDTLAPADIERIEVIKGPTAEQGGVAGSINVILRAAPRLRQRELRAALGYRKLAPQGSMRLSWGDRAGALGYVLPLSAYTWANGATGVQQRVSRPDGTATRVDEVASLDEWRGGGVNFAPRLDWKLGETDTLQWQAFVQRNESRNRGWRETQVLGGPPVETVASASNARGRWDLQRTQLLWVHKRPDGGRLELKAGAQGTSSVADSLWVGRDDEGVPTAQRQHLNSVRERRYSQGGRLRWPLAGTHTLVAGWDLEATHRRELRRLFEDLGGGAAETLDGSLGTAYATEQRRAVVFAQDEWAADERRSVVLGLRAEQARMRGANRAEGRVSTPSALSPVLHLRQAFDDAGRQALRASLSASIRLPDPALLMPRYTLNGAYERDERNTPLAPDTAGNPELRPERARGLELAFETQLPGGGVASVGVFLRRIDDLIRRRVVLETVPEAAVPRWVSRPDNIGGARSSGLELELKGRAVDLLPGATAPGSRLQLRAAASLYRSAVEQIDDPDARLEGQPPWQLTLGFDDRPGASALSYGASLAVTPAYTTQQTDRQRVWRAGVPRLDAFLAWRVDGTLQFRLAATNLRPTDTRSQSQTVEGDGLIASQRLRRTAVTQVTASAVLGF